MCGSKSFIGEVLAGLNELSEGYVPVILDNLCDLFDFRLEIGLKDGHWSLNNMDNENSNK